jgi:hypothetical protein
MARNGNFLGIPKKSLGGVIGLFVFGIVIGAGFTLGGILLRGTWSTAQQKFPGIIPETFNARTVFANDQDIRFSGYASDYDDYLMTNY